VPDKLASNRDTAFSDSSASVENVMQMSRHIIWHGSFGYEQENYAILSGKLYFFI
jgi:hypothetical protein